MPSKYKRKNNHVNPATGYANGELAKYYQETYIALADFNFGWTEQDVYDFQHMWNDGIPIEEMSSKLNRHPIEVAVLIMDRHWIGAIEERKGAIFGNV